MLLILLLPHSVFSHTLELKLEYMDSVGYVDFSKDEPFYSKEHSICNTFYSVLLWHFLYRIQSFLCLFYFEHCIYVLNTVCTLAKGPELLQPGRPFRADSTKQSAPRLSAPRHSDTPRSSTQTFSTPKYLSKLNTMKHLVLHRAGTSTS